MAINLFEDYSMTWKPDIINSNKPIYITIADQLENDIKTGILSPGTKLPPQRELANFLDVNLSTISRAFKLCSQKGLICATIGNGTFVSSDVAANNFLLPDFNSSDIIDMGAMFPESESSDEIVVQMKKMISEPNFGMLFKYGKPEGTVLQRESIVKLIKKTGYETDIKNILLASGGQNAITAILAGLFKSGDRIGTDELTYPGIKTAANMLGIKLIPIKTKNYEITEEGLLFACKNENIKGLYLIPDYHNPTTHTMSIETRKMIGRIAEKENLIIIEDAILSLMNENPMKPIISYAPDNTIYISSASKIMAPGLRLAFVVVPDTYKKALSIALYNLNISISSLMIEIASRIINFGIVDSIIEKKRISVREQNNIIDSYLKGYTVLGDSECIFRWLILPKKFSGESFEAKAYKAGVQVYSAERFIVGNAKPMAAVRLSATAPGNNEKLKEAMKILRNLLEEEE